MTNGRRRSRAGIHAAIAAVVIAAGLGAVGAAGANGTAADHELTAPDSFGPWSPSSDITIQTGDRVTWKFPTGSFHNVETDRRPGHPGVDWSLPTDDPEIDPETSHPDVTHTFTAPGVYAFVCEAHFGSMDGTITVQDEPVTPTPSPSPTATATATPTATPTVIPQPGGGGGGGPSTTTPAPDGGDDTVKPSVRGVKLKALRRAVRVRFRLSEPATVTVRVKRRGSRKALKSARVQARAGTRSVTLRSKRLRKGRYSVEIQARDSFGNRSTLATKRLTLRA